MQLIVGLGNPGAKYHNTRHNIGFEVIDKLADKWQIELATNKFTGASGKGKIGNESVMLLKPLSYMNLSGEVVIAYMRYFKMETSSILVVYDDLDLDVGRLRLRLAGGSGGHNGIKSIIAETGTEEFRRIKVGIGRPTAFFSVSDYVLSIFNADERKLMNTAVENAILAVESVCRQDFVTAMNKYN